MSIFWTKRNKLWIDLSKIKWFIHKLFWKVKKHSWTYLLLNLIQRNYVKTQSKSSINIFKIQTDIFLHRLLWLFRKTDIRLSLLIFLQKKDFNQSLNKRFQKMTTNNQLLHFPTQIFTILKLILNFEMSQWSLSKAV